MLKIIWNLKRNLEGCLVKSCFLQNVFKALVTRTIELREGPMRLELKPDDALVNRDALAKTIYDRLFDWLVV